MSSWAYSFKWDPMMKKRQLLELSVEAETLLQWLARLIAFGEGLFFLYYMKKARLRMRSSCSMKYMGMFHQVSTCNRIAQSVHTHTHTHSHQNSRTLCVCFCETSVCHASCLSICMLNSCWSWCFKTPRGVKLLVRVVRSIRSNYSKIWHIEPCPLPINQAAGFRQGEQISSVQLYWCGGVALWWSEFVLYQRKSAVAVSEIWRNVTQCFLITPLFCWR